MRRSALFAMTITLAIGCGDPPPVTPDSSVGADAGMRDAAPASCPTGTELCGTQCVNTDESRAHCGGCDSACAAGEACIEGACDLVCPTAQTECDGTCADTANDRRNCGACGTACDVGESCVEGACELSCPAGQIVCGALCVDTASNAAHCGACDAACPAGAVCNAGECASTCGAGLEQCGAACVDVQQNSAHCGACDAACAGNIAASGLCIAGACRLECNVGEADCNADLGNTGTDGCETTVGTDPMNCGACGRVCAFSNAVAGCTAGECTLTSCDADFGDCDGVAANGCEADMRYDNFSCGACGNVCPAGDTCVNSVCETTAGETCNDALALSSGANMVAWTATSSDYLTTPPGCSSTSLSGPDIVMSYTASVAEYATITIAKPSSIRWSMVASVGGCGFTAPVASCVSETATTMSDSFLLDAGETVYLYLSDTTVGAAPLSNPLEVTVSATTPSCTPGAGGIVGDTIARIPSGLALSPSFVAADTNPTGYVYVGDTGVLHRVPKGGGPVEDVEALANLTTSQLGYAMVIDGLNIYLVESSTSGTTGHLWRISTNGGATWLVEDYASFPSTPTDDFRAATVHAGRIYLVTHEATTSARTQIWSVDAAATTLPTLATLEHSFLDEHTCSGIARDASNYYLACDHGGNNIVRMPVAGGPTVLITTDINVSDTVNSLSGDDTNADGVFDVLYAHSRDSEHAFICGPTTATPFAATFAGFGGSNLSYGMAFDDVNGVLWSYDYDTDEFVSVQ